MARARAQAVQAVQAVVGARARARDVRGGGAGGVGVRAQESGACARRERDASEDGATRRVTPRAWASEAR